MPRRICPFAKVTLESLINVPSKVYSAIFWPFPTYSLDPNTAISSDLMLTPLMSVAFTTVPSILYFRIVPGVLPGPLATNMFEEVTAMPFGWFKPPTGKPLMKVPSKL